MRPATVLCLLALLVTGASLCNRRLPARGQQAPSLPRRRPAPPSAVRPLLTTEQADALDKGRLRIGEHLLRAWDLSVDDATRVAMEWPAFTPSVSTRLQ